jgi:hypothetical protein
LPFSSNRNGWFWLSFSRFMSYLVVMPNHANQAESAQPACFVKGFTAPAHRHRHANKKGKAQQMLMRGSDAARAARP